VHSNSRGPLLTTVEPTSARVEAFLSLVHPPRARAGVRGARIVDRKRRSAGAGANDRDSRGAAAKRARSNHDAIHPPCASSLRDEKRHRTRALRPPCREHILPGLSSFWKVNKLRPWPSRAQGTSDASSGNADGSEQFLPHARASTVRGDLLMTRQRQAVAEVRIGRGAPRGGHRACARAQTRESTAAGPAGRGSPKL